MNSDPRILPYPEVATAPAVAAAAEPFYLKRPEWKKGLAALADETQAQAGGITAFGAEALRRVAPEIAKPTLESVRDWGTKTHDEQMAEAHGTWQAPAVPKIEDIKFTEEGGLGRFGQYAGYHVPKGVGQMAGSLALGGGGALAGRLAAGSAAKIATKEVGDVVGGRIVTQAVKDQAKEQVGKSMTKGALTGAGLGIAGMEGGQSYGKMAADPEIGPEKALLPAFMYTAGSTALELGTLAAVSKYLGITDVMKGKMREVIKSDKVLANRALELARKGTLGAGAGFAVEGIQEGTQELMQIAAERWAKDEPVFATLTDEDWSGILNGLVAGGLTGATVGGPVGMARNTQAPEPEAEAGPGPEAEAAQPPPAPGMAAPPPPPGAAPSPAPAAAAAAAAAGGASNVEKATEAAQDALVRSGLVPRPAEEVQPAPRVETEVGAVAEAAARAAAPTSGAEIRDDVLEQEPTTVSTAPAAATGEAAPDAGVAEAAVARRVELGATTTTEQPLEPAIDLPTEEVQGDGWEEVTGDELVAAAEDAAAEGAAAPISGKQAFLPDVDVSEDGWTTSTDMSDPLSSLESVKGEYTIYQPDSSASFYVTKGSDQVDVGVFGTLAQAQAKADVETKLDAQNDLMKGWTATPTAFPGSIQYDKPGFSIYSSGGLPEVTLYYGNAEGESQMYGSLEEAVGAATQMEKTGAAAPPAPAAPTASAAPMAEPTEMEMPAGYSLAVMPDGTFGLNTPWSGNAPIEGLSSPEAATAAAELHTKYANGLVTGVDLQVGMDALKKAFPAATSASSAPSTEAGTSSSAGPPTTSSWETTFTSGGLAQLKDFKQGYTLIEDKGGTYTLFDPAGDMVTLDWAVDTSSTTAMKQEAAVHYNKNLGKPSSPIVPSAPTAPAATAAPPSMGAWKHKQLSETTAEWTDPDSGYSAIEYADGTFDVKAPNGEALTIAGFYEYGDLNAVKSTAFADFSKKHPEALGAPTQTPWQMDYSKAEPTYMDYVSGYTAYEDNAGMLETYDPQDNLVVVDGQSLHDTLAGAQKAALEHYNQGKNKTAPPPAAANANEKQLLKSLSNPSAYSLDETMAAMDAYAGEHGEAGLEQFLADAEDTLEVPPVPSLQAWLENMRTEKEMLAEDPHQGIWAEHPKARYGVVVVNPKTGKVMLRRVANDFDGIMWDFARGGKDKGEHPLEAAKREAFEEFGVETTVVGQLATGFYSGKGNSASLYYVAVPKKTVKTDWSGAGEETTEVVWASYEEAKKLLASETTQNSNSSMKLHGPNKKAIARILRTLDATYGLGEQKNGWSYKGSEVATRKYFEGDFEKDYPQPQLHTLAQKSWKGLTPRMRMQVAVAHQMKVLNPKLGQNELFALFKSEFARRANNFKKLTEKKTGKAFTISQVAPGTTADQFKTGDPVVLSTWHATPTKEGLYNDEFNTKYLGQGIGGADTKHAWFLIATEGGAKKFHPSGKVYNMYFMAKNPLVYPINGNWNGSLFTKVIKDAKNGGTAYGDGQVHDGVIFTGVKDTGNGHQIAFWDPAQVVSNELENVSYEGNHYYQAVKEETARTPLAPTEVQDALTEFFGQPVMDKLLDGGWLTIKKGSPQPGVMGRYSPKNDTMTLYADGIETASEAVGALLHEGRHARLDTILGESLESYYGDLNALVARGDTTAEFAYMQTALAGVDRFGIETTLRNEGLTPIARRKEMTRVREAIQAADVSFLVQEDLANYIQHAVVQEQSSGLLRRLLNAIRSWWATTELGKSLKSKGVGPTLSPEMAVALARRAVTAVYSQGRTVPDSAMDQYAFVAHLTQHDWPAQKGYPHGKPKLSKVGTGEGYISFGWGMYFLESKGAHSHYKKSLKVGDTIYDMRFHIPEAVKPKLIEWDRPLEQQHPAVQAAIRNPKDGFLLLRLARKSRDRKTSYPSGPMLHSKGTGGSLYNELRDYFHKKDWNMQPGYAPGGKSKYKNMARKKASLYLNELGVQGVHLLDAGSRKAGHGTYNWVIWDQEELNKIQLIAKNKESWDGTELNPLVDELPFSPTYDPNAIGEDLPVKGMLDALESRNADQKPRAKSKEQVQRELRKELGTEFVQKAEALGLIEYVEGPSPSGEVAAKMSTSTGVITVYLGSQPKDSAALLLHEGNHQNLDVMLGGRLNPLVRDVKTQAERQEKQGQPQGPAARAMRQATSVKYLWLARQLDIPFTLYGLKGPALDKARQELAQQISTELEAVSADQRQWLESTAEVIQREETLAYFVQYAHEKGQKDGLFRRAVNALKAWWLASPMGQAFGRVGLRPTLSDGVAVALAQRATRYGVELAETMGQLGAPKATTAAKAAAKAEAAMMAEASALTRMGVALEALESVADVQSESERNANFQRWFGDSKIVDEEGKPQVVYHGTGARNIRAFDVEHPDKKDHGWLGKGVYVTASPEIASHYAQVKRRHREGKYANVVPLYASVQNPYEAPADLKKTLSRATAEQVGQFTDDLKAQGYDGVIWSGVAGNKEIVVFDPSQVKSAIGNRGTYERGNPNILESMPEVASQAWATDPLDLSAGGKRPGWYNKIVYNYVESLKDLELKSPRLWSFFNRAMSIRSSRQQDVEDRLQKPLIAAVQKLAKTMSTADAPYKVQDLNQALAGQHIIVDAVNQKLALRNSNTYAIQLEKKLRQRAERLQHEALQTMTIDEWKASPGFKEAAELKRLAQWSEKGRLNLIKLKNADGTAPVDADGQPRTPTNQEVQAKVKERLERVFQHVMEDGRVLWYTSPASLGELREQWEHLKYHGGGLATPETLSGLDMVDLDGNVVLDGQGQPRKDVALGRMQQRIQELGVPLASAEYSRVQGQPQFAEISRLVKTAADYSLGLLEATGRLSAGDAAAMREYQHYVPLQREAYTQTSDIIKGFGNSGLKGPKVRAGSVYENVPVHQLQNMFAQVDASIQAASSNDARKELAASVRQSIQDGGAGMWNGWYDDVEQDGDYQPAYDKRGFVTERSVGNNPEDIVFYENGERWLIKPVKDNERALVLSKATQNLDPVTSGFFFKAMEKINAWIRNVNIAWSIPFMLVNAPRDAGTGALNLKATELTDNVGDVMKKYKSSFKMLNSFYRKGERTGPDADVIRDWTAHGGKISYVQSLKPNDVTWSSFEGKLERRIGQFKVLGADVGAAMGPQTSQALGRWMGNARDVLDGLENMNVIMENVMRLSTYRTYVEKKVQPGMSEAEVEAVKNDAAQLSKDVTTNFDRKGFRSHLLGTWFLFAPATIQGNRQVLRNILEGANKQKLWTALGAVATASLLNDLLGAALSDEDEKGEKKWDQIPDYQKEKYGQIAGSDMLWDGHYAQVPLPWVFNVMWRAGSMMGEVVRGKRDVLSVVPELMGMTLATFNPFGEAPSMEDIKKGNPAEMMAMMATPTSVDPLAQIAFNTDGFGRTLGPDKFPGQEYLPDSEMAWNSTPKFYKWLSREVNSLTGGSVAEPGGMDVRPSSYKVLLDMVMGSTFKFVQQVGGLGAGLASGEPPELKDTPVARQFVVEARDTMTAQHYHDRVAKVEQAKKAEKTFLVGPERDLMELQRIRQEYAGELRMKQATLDTERQLRDLRKQLKTTRLRGQDAREKQLEKRVLQVQTRFNRLWKQRVGAS